MAKTRRVKRVPARKGKGLPFRKTAPRLSRYLYVEVRAWFRHVAPLDAADEGAPTVPVLNDAISFDHIVVRAANEQDAYAKGFYDIKVRQNANPDDKTHHVTGSLLNDYVVKL